MRYYYTFGKNTEMPYNGGWVEVIADSFDEADEKFKAKYPNNKDGFLNCAFRYTEEHFVTTNMFNTGNFGARCHKIIQ